MVIKMKRKNKRTINLLSIFIIIGLLFTCVVYASIKIYEIIKNKSELVATYTNNHMYENINTIWFGSFQLAWNEFMDNIIGEEVKFENEESALLKELNKKAFTKDMLNEKDYYIKVDRTTPELKETIINDLEKKFNFTDKNILNNINFKNKENYYTIYSMLNKKFEFLLPFDKVEQDTFKNSQDKFEYFGIKSGSDEKLNDNVNVLFYDDKEFAISLNTKENEEIILYRIDTNDTFENIYKEIKQKSNSYTGDKKFNNGDKLKIPIIDLNTSIYYKELCNKYISGTGGMYITNAIQNICFNLDRFGGNVVSESHIENVYYSDYDKKRLFYFTDKFFLFLKEKDKDMPYMALVVDNNEILKKYEGD